MASRKEQDRAVANAAERIVEPMLARMGFDLVLVEYRREAVGTVLRLYVDREGGVTLDDCARVSQEVSALLDVEDPVPGAYHLEVSSPGLNRPLARERDFVRFAGQSAKVVTVDAIEGRRTFQGVLGGIAEGAVVITVDGRAYRIPLGAIARANIEYRF